MSKSSSWLGRGRQLCINLSVQRKQVYPWWPLGVERRLLYILWMQGLCNYLYKFRIKVSKMKGLSILFGVTVSVVALGTVDNRFKLHSGQTKNYQICVCCFSAKHKALRSKSKDWLYWTRDNEWNDISTCRLLF